MPNSTAARIRYHVGVGSIVGDHDDLPRRRSSRPLLAAGQHDRAGDGDDQQHRRQLEGEHVVAEQVVGELADVGVVRPAIAAAPRRRPATSRPAPTASGRRVAGRHDGGDRAGRRCRGPSPRPAGAGSGSRSVRRSSARSTPSSMITNRNSTTIAPGVDDHLHGGEEVGLHRHEVHGHAEQRQHEAQRGVHRVACRRPRRRAPPSTITDAIDEDDQLHHGGLARSKTRSLGVLVRRRRRLANVG